jgi:lipopolysaccharide assembly outer membrane protein LptD (OstA)
LWFLNKNFILILVLFFAIFIGVFYANNAEVANERQAFQLEKEKLTPKNKLDFSINGMKIESGGGGLGKLNLGDLLSLKKTSFLLDNNVHISEKDFNLYTKEIEYNPFEKTGLAKGEVLVEGKDFFFSGKNANLERTSSGLTLNLENISGVVLGSPFTADKISYNINTKQLSSDNSVIHIWKIPIMWLPTITIELN